nr:MAG TPA: hypothetical protein [Caudoviricetes sp.]
MVADGETLQERDGGGAPAGHTHINTIGYGRKDIT